LGGDIVRIGRLFFLLGYGAVAVSRLDAQAAPAAADTISVLTTALTAFSTRVSGNRRYVDLLNGDYVIPLQRLRTLARVANAEVASRDVYQLCDSLGHCRMAPDAELVIVARPQFSGNDFAWVRVVVRQGTRIKRMPVATSSYRYEVERRRRKWAVVGVATMRQ
jgi:hypothetical protein